MSHLNFFALPYTQRDPPGELYQDVQTTSGRSDTTAFNTGVNLRDVFLGKLRCVICGDDAAVERCHIVPPMDVELWGFLKELQWIPEGVKRSPKHESRNGVIMCRNHHTAFDNWQFFIRFNPVNKKYIFIHYDSYNGSKSLGQFHGKAIALDYKDHRSPLPLLFLSHEYMVRGRNFHQPTTNLSMTNNWQDWIINDSLVNEEANGSFTFKRSPTKPPSSSTGCQPTNIQASTTSIAPADSHLCIAPPSQDLVTQLMTVQRDLPSWKAWQMETMTWEGTAEENIKKYDENVGVNSEEVNK